MSLELRGITKTFGALVANDSIDLKVADGEILAILGENGAGKSTLMNVVYGLLQPDSGSILVNDKAITVHSPLDALEAGIGMVHQHFMLIPVFTVAENIVLGNEKVSKARLLDLNEARAEIKRISDEFNFNVDPDALVEELPVGIQQRVEIIRALIYDAQVLILDEPTAVLTPQETDELLKNLKRLRESGRSIVFISHKLREVKEIADKITIIRRGKVVGTASPSASQEELASLMVGRAVDLKVDKNAQQLGDSIVEVKNFSQLDHYGRPIVDNVSFEVKAGEILAVAGVQGNGQSELAESILGLKEITRGSITVGGHDVLSSSVLENLESGIAYIPEDREKDGLISSFSIAENLILDIHKNKPFSSGGIYFPAAVAANADKRVAEFDVRTQSIYDTASSLSGGNKQKVVIARELSRPVKLVIACQPTRGLDVGSIEFVHKRLVEERDQGRAVMVFSTELDEVFALADRIAIMYKGQIIAIVPATESRENIGLYMAGITPGVHLMLKKILRKTVMPLLAFVLALIIGGIVIGLTDSRVNSQITHPWAFIKILLSTVGNAYLSLFQGAIYDPNLAEGKGFIHGLYPFSETLVAAAPLILCGLAVAVAFKSGLFNIGAQGQFIFGAIGASYVGFHYQLPYGLHIVIAVAFAILLAGVWGGIAGVLKAKTGAHEVIVTIMLNYIAARFILWILRQTAFLRPGRIDPIAPPIKESAHLPLLLGDQFRVNFGIIISLAVAGLVYLLLNRTTLGFRFRAVGANATAAKTAGIAVGATTISAMILSGALAGLGGAIHVLGNQYELTTDIAGSFGFDAITVALLGQGNPVGVVLAAILFAALRVGGVTMQANVQVPVEIVLVIQALVVLFIAAPGLVAKIFRVRKFESGSTLVSKGWNG